MTFSMPGSDQLLGQLGDRAGDRGHVPHPAEPPPRLAGSRTHTLPPALAASMAATRSITNSCSASGISTGPDTTAGFCLCLRRARHFACPPIESIPLHRVGRPGASVKGTEILTGVLEATVGDPARSGPSIKLQGQAHRPIVRRRRRATRPHFHAYEASHKDKES